jgi:penicillin amidase
MKKIIRLVSFGVILLSYVSCFGSPEALNETTSNPLSAKLQGKGCLIFDEPTVAHSKADSELGAYACLGYLHARDRAWQMDYLRRIVEGRKSEVLGYRSLKDDLEMRLLGLDRKAKQLFENMTDEQKAPFQAYAYGVNQGLQTERAKNAYEFKRYGYHPDAWEPVNSIEVLLLQSFDQTRDTFTRKLDEASWQKVYGQNAEALFAREGFPWTTTILKPGEYPVASRAAAQNEIHNEFQEKLYPLPAIDLLKPGETGKGSNNWAIASQKSLTKNAFFANDPHLDLRHPPFWYWAHIEGGAIDAIGATLPGSPFIASGTNHHVAWGLTNSYFDVSELAYVPNEDLKNGNTETFYPLVWVKFGIFKLPFFFKGFQRATQNGVILPVDGGPANHSLVLRWSGFEILPGDLSGGLEIQTAKSVKEADIAFSHMGLPSWNFTYADTQGGIGYRTVGRLPKHEHPLPFGVPVRRLAEWAPWTYLNADEAPHLLQPERGYIVTANNEPWLETARYQAGRAQAASFRAFRIEELLNQSPKHDRESLHAIQCDQQAIDARFTLPPLLKVLEKALASHGVIEFRDAKVIDALKKWNFSADESCLVCGVWNRWTDRIMTAASLNREALYREAVSDHPSDEFLPEVLDGFHRALEDLKVGPQGELRLWGEIHVNPFSHFSGDPAWSVPPIPTGGVTNSVNPGTSQWDPVKGMFIHVGGASQRMVVEMSNPPVVHVTLAGSNQDIEKPNLSDPQGPWMQWKRCEAELKRFPLDWQQVPAQSVTF